MTGIHRRDFRAAFLHRAGLFAGILALIAGILGMHVMTGLHSTHSPAHAAPVTALAHPLSSVPDEAGAPEQCSCPSSCANGHAMTVACSPSAKTGSLSAPLPGSGVIGVISIAADGTGPGLWSYLSSTPSPGELSISRT